MQNRTEPFRTSQYIQTMGRPLHVVQESSAARGLEMVVDIVRHSARDLTGSDGATFILRDHDFRYHTKEDSISPLWKDNRFPMQICISGWVMLNRNPAIIEDIYSDPRIPVNTYQKIYIKSLAMVSIKTNNPTGAIGCYQAKKYNTALEQIKIPQVPADTAAIVVDNIRYQGIIAAKAKQLEDAIDGTLLAITNIVEQKDLHTASHQKRIALIGLAVAEELSRSRGRCEKVPRTGVIHDIGKIGIPSELLAKPAKLTEIEYAPIKTHSEAGYAILKNMPLLSEIAQIILQCHERYNGNGYPHGLKQDEIFPEVQVLAVADVSESMISHRPYRPVLDIDAVTDELVQNKEILYHPDIVDAIIHLVKDKGYQIPE